ncbi:MAG: MBL fold metallo-hydrolase [Gammaproteobacteria bacterium]|nr:MAG: MBL fold metallo-hydrolase [Gammaproteobacteria bacterium]
MQHSLSLKLFTIVLMFFLMSSSVIADETTSYAPVDVEMNPVQVSEHAWYVQGVAGIATDNAGFVSNAGFVVTDGGVVVFDALGTPSLAWLLMKKIRQITDKPIVKVVVSHYHADHILGLQVFKEQGAEIIAPEGAYKYLESEYARERLEERRFSLDPWVNGDTHLVAPDKILPEGESFRVGGIDFTVNVVGGAHSDGDLTMYVENDRVLFSGDIIFEGRIPFLGDSNTRHWLETLEKMQTDELAMLIPGHGPAKENPSHTINLTREYLAYMRKVMGEAVEDLVEFNEAYKNADWSVFKNLPAFEAANRKNAYQVYLSMESELLEK